MTQTTPSTDLNACIKQSIETYFEDLGGETPCDMYDMLIQAVERPVLEVVMLRADHNQSTAARWLGLNRNTLRKKLLLHKML